MGRCCCFSHCYIPCDQNNSWYVLDTQYLLSQLMPSSYWGVNKVFPFGSNSSSTEGQSSCSSLQNDQWSLSCLLTFALCGPSCTVQGWPVWPAGYSRCDVMFLLRVGHKRHHGGCAVENQDWEVLAAILRTLQQPYGEARVMRNRGLLPTAIWVNCLESQSSSPSQAYGPTSILTVAT